MTKRVVATVVGITLFLAAWELFVRAFHVRKFVLRAPSTALAHLWKFRGDFASAALVTIQHAAFGLACALVVSLVLGAALSASRFAEWAVQPVLTLVQVVPWVAYVSSVVLWLGAGDRPAIFMVALACTPAYVFATVDGMRSADPATIELLASVDASRWEVLWRVRLPSAAPALFTASRFNMGFALAVAYFVEGANFSDEGIGSIGRRAASQSSGADALWASVFAMAILGFMGLIALSLLERVVLRWHVSQRPTAN
ncbi:MAG: ABC transporter permease subunit [Actinomycetota bacterium]|nr:ABC transporter permease subunit [Actinomycetota bacterium]